MPDLSDEDLTTIIATVNDDQSDLSGDARSAAMRAAIAADRALNAPGDERAAFEAWLIGFDRGALLHIECDGFYEDWPTQRAWAAWQARASLPQAPAPAVQPSAGSLPPFDDANVQTVYGLLCSTEAPPAGEHWEGWLARKIIAALPPFLGAPIAPEHAEELDRLSDEAVRRFHQDQQDAARYRWLRAVGGKTWTVLETGQSAIGDLYDSAVDAAIDAARALTGNPHA